MIDNAVSHYERLRSQGVKASAAVDGCVQRFGVSRADMMSRVNGCVADHEATMESLARVKAAFEDGASSQWHRADLLGLLKDLYQSVTGEEL